jgi:hypothetical protein
MQPDVIAYTANIFLHARNYSQLPRLCTLHMDSSGGQFSDDKPLKINYKEMARGASRGSPQGCVV